MKQTQLFFCSEVLVYRTNSTGDKSMKTNGMRKKPGPKPTMDEVTTKQPRRTFERNR